MAPIEVETGPMFSGKTSELITQAERLIIAGDIQGVHFLVFNHATDTRYGESVIASHGKTSLAAIPASSSHDILTHIFTLKNDQFQLISGREQLSAIFIDEAQFFDHEIVNVLIFLDDFFRKTLGKNLNIYCAGLDMDFRGEPFGPMPDLLAVANKVNKFTAVCKDCPIESSRDAQYTQRLINGQPANYNDPVVLIGAAESYTAKCHQHHIIPGKPKPKIGKNKT